MQKTHSERTFVNLFVCQKGRFVSWVGGWLRWSGITDLGTEVLLGIKKKKEHYYLVLNYRPPNPPFAIHKHRDTGNYHPMTSVVHRKINCATEFSPLWHFRPFSFWCLHGGTVGLSSGAAPDEDAKISSGL